MTTNKITIVDYGLGNIYNVAHAFEHLGALVQLKNDVKSIAVDEKVVLPGVGNFNEGISRLSEMGVIDALIDRAKVGKPLLGVCLGMQLLFDGSDEDGPNNGLGIIKGWVRKIPARSKDAAQIRIPHIGWEKLNFNASCNTHFLTTDLTKNPSMYFVHSYIPTNVPDENIIATCKLGGHVLPVLVQYRNTFGCQFHPERSGQAGLTILKSFLNYRE